MSAAIGLDGTPIVARIVTEWSTDDAEIAAALRALAALPDPVDRMEAQAHLMLWLGGHLMCEVGAQRARRSRARVRADARERVQYRARGAPE